MLKRILPYVGPLIGLIGISLALYFHAQSVQDRKPLYYVGQRATIVDSAVAIPSPLQVLYQGHPIGNTNVVELVLYFWNGGKLPIRKEDVLEPVAIQLASGEILESRALHISRSVTEFEIHPVSESSRNVLPVSFAILEHDDGAAIQIIYAGKSDTAIAVNGTIVGAGNPRFFSEGRQLRNPEEAARKMKRVDRVMAYIPWLGTAILLILMAVSVLVFRRSDQGPYTSRMKSATIVLGITALLYLGMDIVEFHESHRPEVPYSVLGH
ncbi:MAG: hypothetical protein LAO23_02395 [Acidobacteriia bacterium]|nr:hypothetical protein [Terriglobia bacterium]